MLFRRKSSARGRRSVHSERPSRRPARPGALEWSQDLSGRCARATAIGSRRLLVENHTGILEFGESRVCLNTGCGPMTVCGSGLSLCEVRAGSLIIRGDIRRVDLPSEGGGAST